MSRLSYVLCCAVRVSPLSVALRRDVARQAQACSHSLKSRLAVLEQELDEEREDKKDINAVYLSHSPLQDTLDSLLSRLAESKLRWVDESTALHFNNKERLADFGLNPLDI
ncbi:UNVERIFIED_CONTAM: hypothetical protein FKN15_068663 [Acipenser sinensis]